MASNSANKRVAKKHAATKKGGATAKVQALKKPSATIEARFPVLRDFFGYDWKNVPLRHAFGVYALCLYANLPDYLEVAAEALTEGGDDKDCDLCLIDSEAGDAFIVQASVGDEWNKTTASTNKADDLLTALSWLLTKPYDRVPSGYFHLTDDEKQALANARAEKREQLLVRRCRFLICSPKFK